MPLLLDELSGSSIDIAAFVGSGNHATKGVFQAYHYNNGSGGSGIIQSTNWSEIGGDGSEPHLLLILSLVQQIFLVLQKKAFMLVMDLFQ